VRFAPRNDAESLASLCLMNLPLSTSVTPLVSIPGNPCPDGAVTGRVMTPDGASLRFARWPAVSSARGTVCVFTGRSEAIEKYLETVRELRQRGFTVALMDWRGQGHSSRQLADARKGHVEDFSEFELDVAAFMQRVVLRNCPAPYTALAHSMGGATMLRLVHGGRLWFERVVLTAPMIDFTWPRSSWLLRASMRALRRAGFGERYVPGSNVDRTRAKGFEGNPLTSDPVRYARNVALLEADPTLGVGAPTVAWLDAAFATIMEFRGGGYAEKIAQPILIVAAGDDTVVSSGAIETFAARLPNGSCRVIKGARHEILQETDAHRAEFWAAFDAFV
jgi:lysophospholipase